MNTSFDIAKFIDLETFFDPVKGYLFNDTCVFGVEVFLVKNTPKKQRLSMIHKPVTYFHSWKVTDFSTLRRESYVSDIFGCYRWNIVLYPYGYGEGHGNSISICLRQSSLPSVSKFVVKFILRVKDQKNGKDIKIEYNHLFDTNNSDRGYYRYQFLSFAELKDPKQGFLVNDTLIIEAEVTVLGLVGLVLAKS
ncbi:hypothetical protein Q3G72_002731 [Acer saccharum]|nr:hypothetical protein Q3G72_002731 [Acer saccharum]